MNNRMLATAVILPCLVLAMFVYEPTYGFFTYRLPVADSTIEHLVHHIDYSPVETGDGKRHLVTLEEVSIIDDETIEIRFGQNDYGIYSSGVKVYSPPVFSHVERIKVGQTFVVTCQERDDVPPHPKSTRDVPPGTGISILKYLGLEEHGGIRAYKFLHSSSLTKTPMPCNWPQVIRYTVDALPVVIPDDYMATITSDATLRFWGHAGGNGS